ncbi:vitamin B12 dependent-methionine synthase activation domain-containing protein [Fibrobacterota bacterium]
MTPPANAFQLTFSELDISREQVETSLGYKPAAPPELISQVIEEVLKSADEYCQIKGGYRITDGLTILKDGTGIQIKDAEFSTGKIITGRLKKAGQAALFACTAGSGASGWIRRLFEQKEELRGYIADAVASEAVEAAMDRIQDILAGRMREKGMKITDRYSPGYCGWPVTDQHTLFALLGKNFCGISLTKTALMIPMKSVSGIIGLGPDVKRTGYACNKCEVEQCLYRERRL